MSCPTRQQVITLLTAFAVLLQSVCAAPAACACGDEADISCESCCDHAAALTCCGETGACCQAGDCRPGEASSRCECGCEDGSNRVPLVPVENSERPPGEVESSLAVSHLVTPLADPSPEFRDAFAVEPYACSRPHAMQALLCVWRT